MGWISELNEPQLETLRRLKRWINGAHYTDICMRINGEDQWYQGDWLKYMLAELELPTPPEVKNDA